MSDRFAVLVVDDDHREATALAHDLDGLLGGGASVEVVADAAGARRCAVDAADRGIQVPVAFVDVDLGEAPSTTVVELHDIPQLEHTRNVVVTSKLSLHGADQALRRGAIHGMITRPWTRQGLRAQLVANLAAFLVEHAPDELDRFPGLLDDDDRRLARSRVEQQRRVTRRRPTTTPPLLDATIGDDEIERRMVELLDETLGHPPRIRVAPGTVLIEAGDDVGGIYVLLDGIVRLSTRTDTGEQILHERSTGAIIGLLSLASHRRAMLQCRAVTDVRAVPVTLDQLAEALDAEPRLASLVTRVLIRSLARRLRRSDELQMELDRSLAALSEARAQLVSSARFTALGEMAAGMAHELNNPTAALGRATDHLTDDVLAVIGDPEVRDRVRHQLDAAPTPTSERRRLRRELADVLGDRLLADRIIDIGYTSVHEARRVATMNDEEIARLESGARLGRSLRTVEGAAERIQALVGSLRAYSRGDDGRGPLVDRVDVTAGIDDALRLLSHRMHEVDVVREYRPVPPVAARPGELQQVWTNVLANALDAMGDRGQLTVAVGPTGSDRISVRIIDDGPGVPAELSERIFTPRFTTKNGRVEFGLGLGLSISRQIVDDHGGSIRLQSSPGHTEFVIELPTGAQRE